jgi:general secretion pathway protein B
MSLILEALRKSEAERRRAQVPDLLAEPRAAAAQAPVAVQRWPWLVLGAGLLLGALWLARALLPTQETADAAVATHGIDVAQAPATAPHAPARTAPALQRPLVVAPAVATPPTTTTTSSESSASTAAQASNGSVASAIVAAPTPGVGAVPPTMPATLSAQPTAQPRSQPNETTLSDLGSEERGQLPPLKLSMHMWNEVPAQRFVIIDGNRLGIGARIGELTVADIVSDGVVLDWNGRLLKLPLR